MKSKILILAGFVLILLMLPLAELMAAPTVLRVWKGPHTSDDAAVFSSVIKDFEAAHPNIQIEFTSTPWDTINQKYTTAFASGNPPDIFYGFTGGYVDGVVGRCWDFRKLFSKSEFDQLKKGVADSLLQETTVDGKLISIPWTTAGAGFVYNIDILKKAGFTTPPDTIADLLRYAKAMTGNGTYGYGQLSYDTGEAKPEFFLFAYGCTLLNDSMTEIGYDRPEGLAAFKLIDQLWNKDKSAVPVGLYPGTTMTDAFFSGKFAMMVTHSQIGAHLKDYPGFKLGVSSLPKGPGTALAGGRGTYAGSGFWCVPESGKNSALAKQFIQYLYLPKYQGPIAKAFSFIPSSTETKIEMDENSKAFAAAYLNYGVPYRFNAHLNEVKQAVWRAMQALQSGAIGPEEAWKQAVSEGKAALQ